MSVRGRRTWLVVLAAGAVACGVPGARADVPSPPPASCPDGAEPRAVAHYDSWCEAVTCATAFDCANGADCGGARGLCVRDRDVAGVGWASGHVQHLHEALSTCTTQADCAAGTTCEVVRRCRAPMLPAVQWTPTSPNGPSPGTVYAAGACGCAACTLPLVGLTVYLVRRRRRR